MFLSVRVLVMPMRMTVTSEDEESQYVREQTETAYDEDELRVADFGRVDESCERLEDDRDT